MVRRQPAEETEEYPGLWVHDGRVTGSITISKSRLPYWAFAGWDWSDIVAGWDYIEPEYGWTQQDHANFLHNLLEARGEFGRLLLVIADVQRQEDEEEDENIRQAVADDHPAVFHADEDGIIIGYTPGSGLESVPPWWHNPKHKQRVREQLQRCIDILDQEEDQ